MRILMVFVAAAHITGAAASATDYLQFVRISQPQEEAQLENGSQVTGAGFVFMPEAEKKEDFEVRARLYCPIDGNFEVIREVIAHVGPGFQDEPSTWQYKYNLDLEMPVREGRYLLWVDCFDKSARRSGLLASASEFVTIANPAKERSATPADRDRPVEARTPAEPRDRDREYRLIRILNPVEDERHSSRANILGIGYVFLPHAHRMEDFAVRVRLYRPADRRMELVQEMQVPVQAVRPGQHGTYQYVCDLRRIAPLKDGKHLLQVECLDVIEEEPQVLMSARRFVPVVELRK